jgi:diguanylate cyclase (GGDEF)-like protein
LIVDDEELVRNFIASLFLKYNHASETVGDGIEALERVAQRSFDAVVTDVVMPHMDGITLTKELLRLYPGLPIMVMTAYAHEDYAESAIAAGAREFINKPFSVHEFIVRFDKMMRNHKEEEDLLALSLIDELTGLYNRRRFFILAEQYLKVAVRAKKKLLLLYIDMDDLKWVNDHCGHKEGDQALRTLAKILKKTFRESDIVARIGGDEFVVLSEINDGNGEILTTRLNESIKDYNAQGSGRFILSISVGTTQFDPSSPISIDEVLSKADALMYLQKRKRKSRLGK